VALSVVRASRSHERTDVEEMLLKCGAQRRSCVTIPGRTDVEEMLLKCGAQRRSCVAIPGRTDVDEMLLMWR
jgi:hypothetical protein